MELAVAILGLLSTVASIVWWVLKQREKSAPERAAAATQEAMDADLTTDDPLARAKRLSDLHDKLRRKTAGRGSPIR